MRQPRMPQPGVPASVLKAWMLLCFLLAGAEAWGQDIQVTASVGSDTVGIQDQFQYTIMVSGEDSRDAENPRIHSLQGFLIVAGPNVSSQYQWINGRSSSNKSFVYILIPEREGQFTIGPAEVSVEGKVYRTQKLQVRVTSAARSQPPQSRRPVNPFDPFEEEMEPRRPSLGDSILIRAEVDRNTAYPGQQITLTYRLYTQAGISGIQLQENPPLSGFWVEDLEVDKNPKGVPQVINGREYRTFAIKKQALFATSTGKIKIPSSLFAVSARAAGDLFGMFGRTETLYRKTQELSLDIVPLPAAGRPASFHNAVGAYRLSSGMDKTEATAGDAVALRIRLEGQGNIKMIPDIAFPESPDFTVYSSKHTDSIRPVSGDQIGGARTWEYVLVPKTPGQHTVPSISFSYFDAERAKYETITTQPATLHVLPGKELASFAELSGGNKQPLVRRGTDIHYIKNLAGTLHRHPHPFYYAPWIYMLCGLLLAGNLSLFFHRRRQNVATEDAAGVRSRKAKRNALKHLRLAEKAGASEPRRFYDHAASAFSGYLADRFQLTEIEITGDNLERTLEQHQIPRETMDAIRSCLQDCDFGRFVSASNSPGAMHDLSDRMRRCMDMLEKTAASAPFNKRQAAV